MTSTTTDTLDGPSQYSFSNGDDQGSRQLRILADILDEHSVGILANTGVTAGWRCLDVGPGAGTITNWLADRVHPGGEVTALDLDPRHLRPNAEVTVRQDDIRTADLPDSHFDLIHTRLLLLHLAERDLVLDRLIAALKPGGVLVVSDWESTRRDWMLHAPSPAASMAFARFQTRLLGILEDHGADLGWARRAPLAMRAAGLVDVSTTVHNELWAGGGAGCLLHTSNSHQLEAELLTRGMTAEELDLLREAMGDPDTLAYCYDMFTTVGRRPDKP